MRNKALLPAAAATLFAPLWLELYFSTKSYFLDQQQQQQFECIMAEINVVIVDFYFGQIVFLIAEFSFFVGS